MANRARAGVPGGERGTWKLFRRGSGGIGGRRFGENQDGIRADFGVPAVDFEPLLVGALTVRQRAAPQGDDKPEQAFYMVGGIDEIVRRAEELKNA